MTFMTQWGASTKATTSNAPPVQKFDAQYYRNLFNAPQKPVGTIRMALVARENCAKTGLALSMRKGNTVILDIDNSAGATVEYNYGDDPNIRVLPLLDEMDDSIFNEDNTINYVALTDKVNWYINLIAEQADEIDTVIFDGGSTFLKWCEHSMTYVLQNRSKTPVNPEDGDRFNQAEWRIRNKMFRDTIGRLHGLPIDRIFFTFHLKEIKEFVNDGSGKKVLMKVGERPEWEKGTMRYFSQQIFLTRYMKKADEAAGVKGDSTLGDEEWVVKAEIEEMKGRNMEHLGTTHTILSVKNKEVKWYGLPMLDWGDEATPVSEESDTNDDI